MVNSSSSSRNDACARAYMCQGVCTTGTQTQSLYNGPFARAGSSSTSTGAVEVDMCGGGNSRWAGRHVLLVEDIIDSGNTLSRLAAEMSQCGAASVKVVALLDKKVSLICFKWLIWPTVPSSTSSSSLLPLYATGSLCPFQALRICLPVACLQCSACSWPAAAACTRAC